MTTVINDDACIRGFGGSGGEGSTSGKRVVTYTSNFQLAIEDSNCIVEVNSPTPVTCIVPKFSNEAFKVGVEFEIVQIGGGSVTLVPEDVDVVIEADTLVLDRITSKGYLYHRNEANRFVFSSSGVSIPDGGTTAQALLKQSNDDGDATWQTLTKSLVGLSNVDDTSDANKPISIATQAQLTVLANANVYLTQLVDVDMTTVGNGRLIQAYLDSNNVPRFKFVDLLVQNLFNTELGDTFVTENFNRMITE